MSKLIETRQAYESVSRLLDQAIRQKTGSTKELERCREALDVAFYLLGWSQFEYLVRREFEDAVDEKCGNQTADRHAWRFMRANSKGVRLRQKMDLIFHEDPSTRSQLDKDYDLRNEAAHDYRKLPPEARDLSVWLAGLQDMVEKFKS